VSREDWRSDTKDVVFFGRVVEYKGLDYLIQAQPLVSEAIPEARFVIAGSGPDWQRCRSFIKNSDSFEITDGFIPDSLVAKIVSHAAVVVMPYIEASQSGVVGIAYAFGKPVVATNVGALPKAVKDGETGLLVPPRDPRALADAIIKILTDNDLRQNMGQNALQVADDELSWKRSAEMTYQLYRRLTGSVA
jgi:glycosyltransferase involved in cell wall biosynthesis